MNKEKTRYPLVDHIRGMAVVLMVIFHLAYDLTVFGYLSIDFQKDFIWWFLPRIIVFLFLTAMGMSQPLAHRHGINWRNLRKRVLKIGFFALLISLFTYFAFPKQWVYFGTLHCITVCTVLVAPFHHRRFRFICLALALAIMIPWMGFGHEFPWFELGFNSMDYIPAIPWVSWVLVGIFLFHIKVHQLSMPDLKILRGLQWLGVHSLKIYLIHQVVLFSLIWSIYMIQHKLLG